MNDSLRIAKLLSIFLNMTGLCKDKDSTISFKQQLHNEVLQGRVTGNEERIVLRLMGIERANTINREEDPRLFNILNIVELCTSVKMSNLDLYNYINGEFKTGRINKENRDLLLEAFNIKSGNSGDTKELYKENKIKYLTLEEIRVKGYNITVYQMDNADLDKAAQFTPYNGGFTFMMQDPDILNRIKNDRYDISGTGAKIHGVQYAKRIDAKIDPQEIAQAEQVLQYVQKYNTKLWLTKQAEKDTKSSVNIDKDKKAQGNKGRGIFDLFKR